MNFLEAAARTFVFNQEVNTSKAKPLVEHLGMQTIEGVSAEGTRTTVTIPGRARSATSYRSLR